MGNINDTKFNKKTIKISIIVIVVAVVMLIGIPLIQEIIQDKIEKSQERRVPQIEGKTFEEAEKELKELGLKLQASEGNSESSDAIIIHQYNSYTMKKGETVKVTTKTQEQINKEKEEQKKKEEESGKIWRACSAFTKTVEAVNEGSVIYVSPTSYGETEKSGKVYKLKYKTSNPNHYYYQLVSFNSDYTSVIKSTKLFSFYISDNEETGQTQELEYAYKNTF